MIFEVIISLAIIVLLILLKESIYLYNQIIFYKKQGLIVKDIYPFVGAFYKLLKNATLKGNSY